MTSAVIGLRVTCSGRNGIACSRFITLNCLHLHESERSNAYRGGTVIVTREDDDDDDDVVTTRTLSLSLSHTNTHTHTHTHTHTQSKRSEIT